MILGMIGEQNKATVPSKCPNRTEFLVDHAVILDQALARPTSLRKWTELLRSFRDIYFVYARKTRTFLDDPRTNAFSEKFKLPSPLLLHHRTEARSTWLKTSMAPTISGVDQVYVSVLWSIGMSNLDPAVTIRGLTSIYPR